MKLSKNLKKDSRKMESMVHQKIMYYKQGPNKGKMIMTEIVIALLMIVNGEIKEHLVQPTRVYVTTV